MESNTVWLILGILVILVVAFIGGSATLSPKEGIKFNTTGLLANIREAQKQKGDGAPPANVGADDALRRLPRSLPTATILWVDDHPINNRYERRAFANLGIFCDSYTVNAEALQALNAGGYQLIISDIGRDDPAGGDGWALLAQARATAPKLPFIFYTFQVTDELRERAAGQGASAVIELPGELIDRSLSLITAVLR